ncbi:hypothetical protein Tco_0798019 [Tanacetum coccineum]
MDKGTKNTSYDHIFAGTDPHVLADQTKFVSEGLETVLTQSKIKKEASFTTIHGYKEGASSIIKLEDLAKLVSQIQPSFKDQDSPKDDPAIIIDESDEDELNAETEDTLLELKKNKAKAEFALLKSQPSFSNVEQLNELLVKSLQTEFSKILSSRNFSSSLPTKLKDLPSKINELTEEIKGLKTQVHKLEIELPKELKEIPTKLEDFIKTATSLKSQVAELKTLQRAEKIAEAKKENLNQQPKPTTPPTTIPINPLIITTTTQIQTPLQSPPRSSSQPEGEHIKKDKGKKVMSLEEAKKESTESDYDDEAYVTGSMVKFSKVKKLKKFDFVTKDGRHIHLSKEQINNQKKLEEEAKAEAAK